MPTERLAIIGTGGHAKVVVDALAKLGWSVPSLDFYSEDRSVVGTRFAGSTIMFLGDADLSARAFHVAIGSNSVRRRIAEALAAFGGVRHSIVHPQAMISASCRIGDGSFVAAGAIVGPDAEVGAGCIVNHGAIVDHDCRVADYCHVAPRTTLGGGALLDSGVLVGAGAVVLPSVRVGRGAIIGAGAVVHRNVPSDQTYVGVPARNIQESKT